MKVKSYIIKEILAGFNTDLILGNKPSAILKGLNLDLEQERGVLRKRNGYSIFGTQVQDDKDILGLHEFITSSGTRIPLVVTNNAGDTNAVLKYYSTNWATSGLTDLTASKECRFANFLGYCFVTNGEEIKSSTDGDTWGAANLTGARAAKDVLVYSDILFLIGLKGYASDIMWSEVPTKVDFSSSYTLSWTDDNNTIIRLGDGEDLVGGMPYRGSLYLFKPSSVVRTTYPIRDNGIRTLSENIGAQNKDCIRVVGGQLLFYCEGKRDSKRGIYSYVSTSDSEPQIISEPMQPYIDGMTAGQNTVGMTLNNLYILYVGDVVNPEYDINITDCCLVFDTQTNQWLGAWSFGQTIKKSTQITQSSITKPYIGNDDGTVYVTDNGHTDNSAAIPLTATSHVYDISENSKVRIGYDKRSVLSISILGENLDNLVFRYRFDKRAMDKDGWTEVSGLKTPIHTIPIRNIKANLWQYELAHIGKVDKQPIVRKIVLLYE